MRNEIRHFFMCRYKIAPEEVLKVHKDLQNLSF